MAQTSDLRLTDLIVRVDQDRLVIPDFQRGFKWRANDIRKLLESLLLDYPIGAALFWRTQRSSLTFRRIEDIELADNDDDPNEASDQESANPAEEIDFILDGQQRITSIYKLFPKSLAPTEKEMEHRLKGLRFFLDLSKLGLPMTPDDLSVSHFEQYADPDKVDDAIIEKTHPQLRKDFRTLFATSAPQRLTDANIQQICTRNLWLPLTRDFLDNKLTVLYRLRGEALHKLRQTVSQLDYNTTIRDEEIESYFDRWMDWFTSTFVSKLNSKTLAVLVVQNERPEGLARIFETINSTGMTLSVFDLLVARLGTWNTKEGETNLRKIIDSSVPKLYLRYFDDEHSLGGIASQQIPRALALKAGIELKKGEILNASKDRLLKFKDEIGDSIRFSLETLHERLSIIDASYLPFRDCISLLAAYYNSSLTDERTNGAIGLIWAASIIEDWDNGTNDKTRAWFGEFTQLANGKLDKASLLRRLEARFPSFEDVRDAPTKSTIYKTLVCFNLARGGIDWAKNVRSPQTELEDHHIFPKDWLSNNQSPEVNKAEWRTLRDSVLNRILVSKEANRDAKAKVPPVYLNQLSKPERRTLQIPEEFLGPLPTPIPFQDFNSYLNARYLLMKGDFIQCVKENLNV